MIHVVSNVSGGDTKSGDKCRGNNIWTRLIQLVKNTKKYLDFPEPCMTMVQIVSNNNIFINTEITIIYNDSNYENTPIRRDKGYWTEISGRFERQDGHFLPIISIIQVESCLQGI